MGHGDSVLISLPNGKMVVIDCGSMRWDGNYWNPPQKPDVLRHSAMTNVLGTERFLLNNKEIDLLILTHPDRDHCFEVYSLFEYYGTDGLMPSTTVKQVFYSEEFTTYGRHGVPNVLWKKSAKEIYALTINQNGSSYGKVTKHDWNKTTLDTEDIPASADNKAEILKKSNVATTKNFVKILDGTAKNGIDCGVYFLASNVQAYQDIQDNSSQDNRGSIVTLIIYGDKKFLFMGDSTTATEHFLYQTYGNLIKDVEVLHIPHHASYNTSSSKTFREHVNPCYAVITAAWDSGPNLGLPRYEILDLYHKGTRLKTKPDDVKPVMKKIACYHYKTVTETKLDKKTGQQVTKTGDANVWVDFAAPKHIWCTGSHGPIDFDYEQLKDGSVERIGEKPVEIKMDLKDDKKDDKKKDDSMDVKKDG
jgi:beta-lactamase superfamily II metal-dependent hydrolase